MCADTRIEVRSRFHRILAGIRARADNCWCGTERKIAEGDQLPAEVPGDSDRDQTSGREYPDRESGRRDIRGGRAVRRREDGSSGEYTEDIKPKEVAWIHLLDDLQPMW